MAEKAETDVAYSTHDEKNTQASDPGFSEMAGRRKSVAVNLVENPLKVSFAMFSLFP